MGGKVSNGNCPPFGHMTYTVYPGPQWCVRKTFSTYFVTIGQWQITLISFGAKPWEIKGEFHSLCNLPFVVQRCKKIRQTTNWYLTLGWQSSNSDDIGVYIVPVNSFKQGSCQPLEGSPRPCANFVSLYLQSRQVTHTPKDSINELIFWKMNLL